MNRSSLPRQPVPPCCPLTERAAWPPRPPESDAYTITGVTGFEEGVAQLLSQETASFTVQPMAGLAVKEYSGDLSLSGSGNSQVTINATCVLNEGQAVVTEAPQP